MFLSWWPWEIKCDVIFYCILSSRHTGLKRFPRTYQPLYKVCMTLYPVKVKLSMFYFREASPPHYLNYFKKCVWPCTLKLRMCFFREASPPNSHWGYPESPLMMCLIAQTKCSSFWLVAPTGKLCSQIYQAAQSWSCHCLSSITMASSAK